MEATIAFSFVTVVCLVGALSSAWKKWENGIVIYFLLTLGFGFVSIHAAINEVGYGRVPEKAEPFAKRLNAGMSYQVLGSIKDGGAEVIFVKPHSGGVATTKLHALRVKEGEAPPERFTLIDGKPVAVVVDKVAK
jgi:hypothetical protein